MDNELRQLCKEVYEKTKGKWSVNNGSSTDWWMVTGDGIVSVKAHREYNDFWTVVAPLYTSDYLLEKLPTGVQLHKDSEQYGAYRPPVYGGADTNSRVEGRIRWTSDTPLKALLKLVLALHESGEL